jgi:large subunit ribosomal protein L6
LEEKVSRTGRAPISIPHGVSVDIKKNVVRVKGPKGELEQKIDASIKVNVADGSVQVARATDNRQHRAFHGLYRALIANMIKGVSEGFSKQLEIVGVGYRAETRGKSLFLQLGYSHPIVYLAPATIAISTPSATSIIISGANKELVGLVAAKIRSFRPPEPYKGKGIRYTGEEIRRKAGKSAG